MRAPSRDMPCSPHDPPPRYACRLISRRRDMRSEAHPHPIMRFGSSPLVVKKTAPAEVSAGAMIYMGLALHHA